MKHLLFTLYEYLALYVGLGMLAVLCISWIPIATILYIILPSELGAKVGRFAIMNGFNVYVRFLSLIGACHFDLRSLDELRNSSPVIIAPNHPCLLDAVMVISRLPNVVCIMKASLMNNFFLGIGARLARYICNDSSIDLVVNASESLKKGNHLLIFPEGTRTTSLPVNSFKGSIALIARRAGVEVQTVFIETDSAYLSKGWPLFRKPSLPINYHVRLGKSFKPEGNQKTFMKELEQYYTDEFSDHDPMPEFTQSMLVVEHTHK